MPKGEYGDLVYDFFGKGSVIVFGNIEDHKEQLEAMGGKYGDKLHYSPLQNGRNWSPKMGHTRGYYFTSKTGKESAVKYVQQVNQSIFAKEDELSVKLGYTILKRGDFRPGERVRTMYGLGTVTEHEPKYNKETTVCVKLDKPTYNYGWQGMQQIFIECRTYEIVPLDLVNKIEIQKQYDKYVKGHIFEPNFAWVTIKWKDDGEVHEGYVIALNDTYKAFPEEDEKVFFEVENIHDLCNLTDKNNGEDFVIIPDSVSFFDKL